MAKSGKLFAVIVTKMVIMLTKEKMSENPATYIQYDLILVKLLLYKRLSPNAISVLAYIQLEAPKHNRVRIHRDKIEKEQPFSVTSFYKGMRELREKNAITQISANYYMLNPTFGFRGHTTTKDEIQRQYDKLRLKKHDQKDRKKNVQKNINQSTLELEPTHSNFKDTCQTKNQRDLPQQSQ